MGKTVFEGSNLFIFIISDMQTANKFNRKWLNLKNKGPTLL